MSYPNPEIPPKICPACGQTNKPIAATCEACDAGLADNGYIPLAAPGSPLAEGFFDSVEQLEVKS